MKKYLKALTFLIILSIIARIIYLFITPIDCWATDSSYHAILGKEIATFDIIPTYDLYVTNFYHWVPGLYHLTEAAFFKIIPSIKGFEVISLIYSILTIPLCYLTFKYAMGKEKAILATFFLAIYPVNLRLSTAIMVDAQTIFLSFLSFYSFLLVEKTGKIKYQLLLAVSLGLLISGKYTGFVVAGIMFLWKLYERKNFKRYFLILFLGILIGSPWYLRNFLNTGTPFTFCPLEEEMTLNDIPKNIKWFFIRFWDSVEISEFAGRGIETPVPFLEKILLLYVLLGIPYFLFFVLGISSKTNLDKFMLIWLACHMVFSIYFLTTGWNAGFLPRVATFSLPLFCYLFTNGVSITFLKRYSNLIVLFLLLTGLSYLTFIGVKLYLKNIDEKKLEPAYEWIRKNTDKNSFIVASHPVQVSLFTERKCGEKIPDLSNYNEIYLYNRIKDKARLDYPIENYEKLYDDGITVIYKIK